MQHQVCLIARSTTEYIYLINISPYLIWGMHPFLFIGGVIHSHRKIGAEPVIITTSRIISAPVWFNLRHLYQWIPSTFMKEVLEHLYLVMIKDILSCYFLELSQCVSNNTKPAPLSLTKVNFNHLQVQSVPSPANNYNCKRFWWASGLPYGPRAHTQQDLKFR